MGLRHTHAISRVKYPCIGLENRRHAGSNVILKWVYGVCYPLMVGMHVAQGHRV